MTGFRLFATTRRWGVVVGVILASGILIIVCGPVGYSINPRAGYLIAVAAQIPLIPAICIQASLASPLRAQEASAGRSLGRWRLAHVLVLSALAAAVLCLGVQFLSAGPEVMMNGYAELTPLAVTRNLLALEGAALLCAWMVGPAFGWMLPLAWATLPYVIFAKPSDDPTSVLTVLMQPDSEFTSAAFASAVWVAGAAVSVRAGSSSRRSITTGA